MNSISGGSRDGLEELKHINPVIDQRLELYDCLVKICPKELAKLQKASDNDKPKILNTIAKKVLLTSKTKEDASHIKFRSKTLGWRIGNFFRKLFGTSTQKYTNIQDALKITRKYFSESLETLSPEEKAKISALKDIINVLIQKTGLGEPISDRKSSKAEFPTQEAERTTQFVKTTALGVETPVPTTKTQKQPTWYPKYEKSFQRELQNAFEEIPFDEFIGTLRQINDDWSGTSQDTSTMEVVDSLQSLAKESRLPLSFTEQKGIKVLKHADVIALFSALSKPLELSSKMAKSASPDEAIALQKAVISKMAEAYSAIKNHTHWERATSAFEEITKSKKQLSALNLEAIKNLAIPAVTQSLQSFQQGTLPDDKVEDLLKICKTLDRLAPRLKEQMKLLEQGMKPPAASEQMTLSEVLPTLKDYREASSLLDIRKQPTLAKLLESIDTVETKLIKAESLHALREQLGALPAKIQALQNKNRSLVDNEGSRYFFNEVHISSKPLRAYVDSLTMDTFGKKEAPKTFDEIQMLLEKKQNELAKCAEGLDALEQLKTLLPRVLEKVSVKALKETQTPLSSFFPLLAKRAEWGEIERAIKNSGGSFQIKKTESYKQLNEEFKTPDAKALIDNERKIEKAVANGISFKLDGYVQELITLSTAFKEMTERYLEIGEQIAHWNTKSKGKFWEEITGKLDNWAGRAGKTNQILTKQSAAIEQLKSKPAPAKTATQKKTHLQEEIHDIKDALINVRLPKRPIEEKFQNDAVNEDEW